MSDNLISRKELKEILSASKNFENLSKEEQLYIIHEKLKSLEELYNEEKDLFSQDQYFLSDTQIAAKDKMIEYSLQDDLVSAYYEILKFFEDNASHEDKVHIQELNGIYFGLKRVIESIEQSIDMENILSQLIKHFTTDAMIQFSLCDSNKEIILNGRILTISSDNQELEITDESKIEELKKVIIEFKDSLYDFSKRQETIDIEEYDGECYGAIDGILFSICNYADSELNEFYNCFKEKVYVVVDSLDSDVSESFLEQYQKIAEMINVPLEKIEKNSKKIEERDSIYYINPTGPSMIVDKNLDYLITSYPVGDVENFLSLYRNLKIEEIRVEEPVILMDNMEQKIDELNNDMIEEINHDYQIDRSIGNVFDLSESLIASRDLDLFWKRVSSDTLGYIMVKELEDNNALDMENVKKNFSSYNNFYSICTTAELTSKNKSIVNIVSMLRQAPMKTLKTIYEIICDNLKIEKVFDDESSNFKYTISSDAYYNFEISFPFETSSVVKNSESSFKVGDINIMLAKCASLEKIDERANQWLENSAKTNSQTILKDLDREYYLKGSQTKVLEKQLEKNNRRRVYKFIYLNEAMVIFAYSSLNQDLSEIIDNAITSINLLS